jgi:uncharacterized FAD-dependent dehydrogenase
MCAYRLLEKRPSARIIIIEKGGRLGSRVCPVVAKKVPSCIRCESCAIMEGVAGAGAFSDGKYIISCEYGGWLPDFLPPETVLGYIEQADSILVSFGATEQRFEPDNELKKLCLKYDLHMQQATVKHLGTDANFETMLKMVESLEPRCEIATGTLAEDVEAGSHTISLRTGGQQRNI